MSDSKKLRALKEIRRKNLEKNLLEVQLKGQDHYVFINDRNKAQVVNKDGAWVTEHIRTSILKFNFEIDKKYILFHLMSYQMSAISFDTVNIIRGQDVTTSLFHR